VFSLKLTQLGQRSKLTTYFDFLGMTSYLQKIHFIALKPTIKYIKYRLHEDALPKLYLVFTPLSVLEKKTFKANALFGTWCAIYAIDEIVVHKN
jgi:hypothetical protein